MRPPRFAMLLIGGAVATTPRARAEGNRWEWEGPHCRASAPLFHSRLGKLLDDSEQRRLSGRVRIAGRAKRWMVDVSIELDGRHLGERRFEAKSCEAAAETAAVTASLAVFEGPERAPNETAQRAPVPAPSRTEQRPPLVRTKAAPPPVEPRLGVLGGLEGGALPQWGLGANLIAEIGLSDRHSFALLGSFTAEQERPLGDGRSVSLRLLSATARSCSALASGARYRLDGCAGARFMTVLGQGAGFDVNRAASLQWVAPMLAVSASLRAPSVVEWRLELDASLPLSRRRFLVDGEEVSRPDVLLLGLRLGPVLRFR
jgi:hypothetical protein